MKYLIGSVIFLLTFGVYLYTSVPCITEDDSGEFCGVGATLGVAHSPGYPVYSMCGKILNTILPFASPAYRVNLNSSLFLALSVMILYFIILSITESIFGACAISLLYAFSGVVWAMGNSTEVYGLAALTAVLICYMIFFPAAEHPRQESGDESVLANRRDVAYFKGTSGSCQRGSTYGQAGSVIIFYLLGLGLACHYTLGLMMPGLFWWVYQKSGSSKDFIRKEIPSAFIAGTAGFSIVLFILIRAQTNPLFGWEDPKTIERFWQVIARLRYGAVSLAQGGAPPMSLEAVSKKLVFFFEMLSNNLTPAGLVLFIAGLYFSFKSKINGWAKILLLLGTGPGFLLLANVRIGAGSSELLERFFFLSFLFVALIISDAVKRIPKAVIPVLIVLPVFLFANNLESMNRRNEYAFYDSAKNIIKTLPPNTTLFSDRADEMEFCLGYLILAEKFRNDITLIDCNAGITRSIYGDDYYRIWGRPRLEIRKRVESSLITRINGPVYYASFLAEKIDLDVVQEGLVFRNKPKVWKHQDFPYAEIYCMRRNFMEKPDSIRVSNIFIAYYDLLGKYYLGIKDIETAEKCFANISSFDKSDKWAANLGFEFHKLGYLDKALEYYTKSITNNNPDISVLINMGAIYEAKGMSDQAIETYSAASRLNPENAQVHYNMAVLYWKIRKWDMVINEFTKVLELDPANLEAKKYLELAKRQGNIK